MSLFDLVFGCSHKRRSFPMTTRGAKRRSNPAASITGTYVVCLDCGKEFPYDWKQMKIVNTKNVQPNPIPAVVAERKVA